MKSLRKFVVGALLIGATGTMLYAAPGDATDPDDGAVTAPAATQAVLTPEEMKIAGQEMTKSIHAMLRHVTQLREKAIKEKDIIKLNCLNDKLMPLKAQVNLADAKSHQLDEAVQSNDEAGRYNAYSDLTASHEKVRTLRDEADACVGEPLTFVGETQVEWTGPENPLEPDDNPWDPGIEPPTYRTPWS
jgi:hypothetical protein